MPCREPTDSSSVTLPASMQTLLQRYTDRKLTEEERLILAHATPNVRCEALRIFFEMNDAAAGVEYVLANSGASPRSHGGTSARASRSGGTSTTAPAAAPVLAASKALKSLSTNTLNAANAGAKSRDAAASGANRPLAASAPSGNAAFRDEVRKPAGTGRAVVPASGSTALSPAAKAGSCLHRTRVARSGESVCTLVTVSSMSSEDSGDDAELRPAETPAREEGAEAVMPPTVTLRSRDPRANAGAAAVVPAVPLLALHAVLKQHGSNSNSSASSPSAGVAHSECRPSVSPAMTNTTTAAATAQPRDVSPSIVPPPGCQRLSPAVPKPSTTATAAAPGSTPAAPPSLPSTAHEDAGDDEEPRKTVAAKPTGYYANPTATHTSPVPHPRQPCYAGLVDSKPTAVRGAHRRDRTSTFGEPQGGVDVDYRELPCNHSSPSPSWTPPSLAGSGAVSKCGTDWAALVAAAPAPQLPTVPAVVTTEPAAAVPASPWKDHRTAPKEAADTTPASGLCSPRLPTEASRDQPKRTRGSGFDDTATAANNSDRAGKTQQSPRAPRVPLTDRKREAEGSDSHSPCNVRHPGSGTPQLSPPPPPSKLGGASPIKRGAAWDETTGMYITHPNQLRRQRAARSVATAALTARLSAAVCGVSGSAMEPPDTLHYHFARTASSTPDSALLTSMPTATAAAHAAGSVPLGRLCSSAVHIAGGADATSARSWAAALPSSKDDKQKKRKQETKRAKVLTGASTWKRPIETKKTATALAVSPAVVPIVASPRLTRYQRVCCEDVPVKYDFYGHSGKTIMLQRQASQYPTQMLAAAASGSPSKPHRTASASQTVRSAAPVARTERCYSVMKGGGVEVVEVETAQPSAQAPCPSTIRTPRSARFRPQQHPRGLVGEPAAAMVSARGSAAERACQAPGAAVPVCAALVPPAHCSVFERLTSNYYDVYSSEVALQATRRRR
ncbi:hypothetical protein conserved [Leishmania donovani]|uniref:Uncharacterized protein n=3 Tax=Leishmania donovani species complex TaxID=38574 RepID=A4HY11_LEIIN|nr:conserved hypothetical protein [Leishmania infantum JPCM5]CAC9481482.1 hypothetical_protein_-_conserved [Leishmania infantum]CAJ1988085.1 hypothetical protein conserved [Leishmania donovani]CAM67193.2 conserved hypothetical protein [Leishmania infantum JPCM5]SUZ41067.1 hypothetical_protein_-_conserved [Leishmania infantum]VDZ43972.1 hypothetical_protein_conserved [Leishmania donovani]|eukprot:XP_001464952.2 conserved hypothetical protein [Leishmania infantum JPCM5]